MIVPQYTPAVKDPVVFDLGVRHRPPNIVGYFYFLLCLPLNPAYAKDEVSKLFESCALERFGKEVRQYGCHQLILEGDFSTLN